MELATLSVILSVFVVVGKLRHQYRFGFLNKLWPTRHGMKKTLAFTIAVVSDFRLLSWTEIFMYWKNYRRT